MRKVVIRNMKESDLKSVLAIENESFKTPWSVAQFFYELNENPFSHLWVIEINDVVEGFIDFWTTFDSSTLCQIAVSSSSRQKSFASKLILMMFNYLAFNQIISSTLEVRTNNLSAISFYLKHGYSNIVTKPHYYENGDDAYYFVKGIAIWNH